MSRITVTVVFFNIFIVLALSCSGTVSGFSRIEYNIPKHINITPVDLEKAFSGLKTDQSTVYYAEIVLYSYSSGAESISFSGGDEMINNRKDGKIKGLIKIMDGKRIIQAVFIEGDGKTKEEVVSSLANDAVLKLK